MDNLYPLLKMFSAMRCVISIPDDQAVRGRPLSLFHYRCLLSFRHVGQIRFTFLLQQLTDLKHFTDVIISTPQENNLRKC